MKFLIWLGIAVAIYYLFFARKNRKINTDSMQNNSSNKEHKEITTELVECSHCGTFIDINEAILSNGKYFCSNKCLKSN